MPTNQFLPIATSGGANVATQADYAANSGILNNGFLSGVVDSPTWNKTLRQTSLVAALIGQIIIDQAGVDANDTDSVATLEANYLRAMRKFETTGSYGVDTGSAANIYQFAYVPSVSSVTDGQVFKIRVSHTNNAGATFTPNPGTIAAAPIWSTNHLALTGGEMFATGDAWLQWNSTLNGTGVWLLIHSTGGNLRAGRFLGVQIISATGTYTPTTGMGFVIAKAVGAGAGSGGCAATGASTSAATGGASSGSYAEGLFSALTIGASVACTIGAAGTAGAAGANTGGNGGTTSFGALMSAPGGLGSVGSSAQTAPFGAAGANPGSIATGGNIINSTGIAGANGFSLTGLLRSGNGGGSPMFNSGGGGKAVGDAVGNTGDVPGAGASGTGSSFSNAARAGVAGTAGQIIVLEFSA